MLLDNLKSLGFDEKETSLYLAALELGQATISQLAKKAGIKRSTVYLVLDALQKKGLISSAQKKKSTFYIAEDPRKIEIQLEEKKNLASKIMPELLSLTNIIDKKPSIKYFEGKDGLKEAYKDTLNYPDSELLTCFSDSFKVFSEDFFYDYYIPKRKEKKIWARAILPDTEEMRKMSTHDVEHLRRSRFMPKEKFFSSIEFDIYGKNKVAFISYEEEVALIVESQKINDSLKSLFEYIWNTLPEKLPEIS